MTARTRAAWLAARSFVPLPAIAAVAGVGGAGGVVVLASGPGRLRAWVLLTGVALAVVAAGAVADPTESLTASCPVGRRRRWTTRVAVAATAVAAATAVIVGLATLAASDGAVASTDAALRIAASAMVGWATAATATRWRGPGVAVRCAAPAVVAFHIGVDLIESGQPAGTPWRLDTTGGWVVMLAGATVVFTLASSDPARGLWYVRR